jgi:hypothetical protein
MNLRWLILLAGAVVLTVGLVGLLLPVSVSGPNGESIGCGNAIAENLSGARAADDRNLANLPVLNQVIPHTNYVAECSSSVSERRAWSIPVNIVGALVIAGSFFAGGRIGSPRGAN